MTDIHSLPIELNPHFKPDVAVVTCGSKAYYELQGETTDVSRHSSEFEIKWRVYVIDQTGKMVHVYVRDGKPFVSARRKGVFDYFVDYNEAREIAFKLMRSKRFFKVVIVEEFEVACL